jgi:isoleucyl-tRNA synthetase
MPLVRYLQAELNVRDVVFTGDEKLAGVRYRAVADWSVLGRKLRRDLARVKNALPNVSSADVKEYAKTGKITVDGIDLVEGDLTVQRYVEMSDVKGQYGSHSDNDVVVLLDVQVHQDLMGEWLARELVNRVQKLRKKAGLQATDDVDVFYQISEGTGAELLDAMSKHAESIKKTVRSSPADVKERKPSQKVLIEEEQEIADTTFVLSLANQ